jgi:putative redox protein
VARILEARVDQTGPTTGKGTVRTHSVVIDRPVEKGGADQGAMGGELLLASLGGCFLSNLLAAVAARSADVANVRVSIAGTVGGVPERFESIEMRVSATYSDVDAMRKLVNIAERGCLVTNTLRTALLITVVLEPEAS